MKNVIILAYADDEAIPLKHLAREGKTIYDYLQFNNRGEVNVRLLKKATFKDILDEFRTYRDEIILFHFSGHAGKAELIFEEGATRAKGLAALLALAPNLELVFLNGCATTDQVDILHGKHAPDKTSGVKRVVATSREVFDDTAADFAIYFYSALCRYWNVGQAFDYAKAFVLAGEEYLVFPEGNARHIGTRMTEASEKKGFPWGIYYKEVKGKSKTDEYKALDEYTLPDKEAYVTSNAEYEPNIELIKTIGSKGKIIYDSLVKLRDNLGSSTPGFQMEIDEFDELQTLYRDYENGNIESITPLANRTVNMLPKPLGSLLRQMISEAIEIDDNQKKNFENLLDLQLRFYTTMVKLCCFTLLSDLFNLVDNPDGLVIKMNKVQRKFVRDFFEISEKEKDEFDFVTLIKIIREVIHTNLGKPFVQEYLELQEHSSYASSYFDSHMFIRGVKLKRQQGKLGNYLVGFCQNVEKELINIFNSVYFILRYKLLVIKNVEAIRTRTVLAKSYKHRVIVLRQNITGMLEENELPPMEDYTETHSVIVVRGLYRIIDYLSLSPFVLDRNVLTNDQSSELFFYSHVDKGLVFESIEDNSRKMEIETIEKTEVIKKNGTETLETKINIPYVDNMIGKKPFEKAKITSRLVLVKDQFAYIRDKIDKIKPTTSENKVLSPDNP